MKVRHLAAVRAAFFLTVSCVALSANADELDIQASGPAIRLQAGAASHLAYRDNLLSEQAAAYVFGGIAHNGFALSLWAAGANSRARAKELLLSYSYKLPLADVHAGYTYVDLGPTWGVNDGAWRVGATTNNSTSTEAELLHDRAINGPYRATTARITHKFWTSGPMTLAGQVSASRMKVPAGNSSCSTLALLLSKTLAPDLEFELSVHRIDSHAPPALSGRRREGGLSVSLTKSL